MSGSWLVLEAIPVDRPGFPGALLSLELNLLLIILLLIFQERLLAQRYILRRMGGMPTDMATLLLRC